MEIIGLKEFIFSFLKLTAVFTPFVLMFFDICNFFNQLKNHHKNIDVIEPPYGLQPFLGVQREPSENIVTIPDNGFFNGENYVAYNRISG